MWTFIKLMLIAHAASTNGVPIQKRFLFDLFGHSYQNPGDMSNELGIHNSNVGDQTNGLVLQHQIMSAGVTGTGYVQHQGHSGPDFQSQNVAYSHGVDHLPGKCSSLSQHCPPECSTVDTVTGCIICKNNCLSVQNAAATSSFSSKTQTPTKTTVTLGAHCPVFPSGCPRGSVALVNGCPICTVPHSTLAPRTTTSSPTCAPLRCVAPCNKGIVINKAGCPQCLC